MTNRTPDDNAESAASTADFRFLTRAIGCGKFLAAKRYAKEDEMHALDQVTITPENEPFFRAALTIFTEHQAELEEVLAKEPVPFDVEGCKFQLAKPEEVGQVIQMLQDKLGIK